jgi:hypothetical protein
MTVTDQRDRIAHLREISWRALAQMYLPEQKRFVFRVRDDKPKPRPEGISVRYTAITLIGLAGEDQQQASDTMAGHSCTEVCQSLLDATPDFTNFGDIALTLWAAQRIGNLDVGAALKRLQTLFVTPNLPTVEVAWAVTALSLMHQDEDTIKFRDSASTKLRAAYVANTGLFRHHVDHHNLIRGHVACFADLVYPIQAFSHLAKVAPESEALAIAEHCAQTTCNLLGESGQWWWHYDVRTGKVLEGYPVYSVHQDAMAPMCLFDLADAGGTLHRAAIQKGLDWLYASPELSGASLIDDEKGVVWRKVARREPAKFVRQAQALSTCLHPGLRVPGVNMLFPPGTIDDECRPYHLGWLLYAWPARRVADWDASTGE